MIIKVEKKRESFLIYHYHTPIKFNSTPLSLKFSSSSNSESNSDILDFSFIKHKLIFLSIAFYCLKLLCRLIKMSFSSLLRSFEKKKEQKVIFKKNTTVKSSGKLNGKLSLLFLEAAMKL